MLATSCTRSPSRAPSTTADGPSAPRRRSASSSSESPSDALRGLHGEHLQAPALGRTRSQRSQIGASAVAPATGAGRLLELAHALGQRRHGLGQLLGRGAQRGSRLARRAVGTAQRAERLGACDRLDAPHALAHGRLAHDRERADRGGRAHVRAAAQLHRVAGDVDDAHDVAVLLAEQHRGAELARRVLRGLEDVQVVILEHDAVDLVLDRAQLLGGDRRGMREVEAQALGTHGGARLLDVLAQVVAQRALQQVRAGVVGHRRPAPARRRPGRAPCRRARARRPAARAAPGRRRGGRPTRPGRARRER